MHQSTTIITKLIGIGFLILSILRLTPIINLNGRIVFYFAVAAFFFILSDLIEFIVESVQEKNGNESSKILNVIHSCFVACAIISIIVLPYLTINISIKNINSLSDTVTLAGLGIAILIIGLKTEKMQRRMLTKGIKEIVIKELKRELEEKSN